MWNNTGAFLLIFVSSLFGAGSTLFFKLGAAQGISFRNKKLYWAVGLAGVSFIFYLYALKLASLTFIYLTASISYLWAVMVAKVILKERLTAMKLAGIFLVVAGIVVLHLPLG